MNEKFWILDNLDKFLLRIGLGTNFSDAIIFILITAVLAGIIKLANYISGKLICFILNNKHFKIKDNIKNIILHNKMLSRLLNFILLLIARGISDTIYQGFSKNVMTFVDHSLSVAAIIAFTLILMSVIELVYEIYSQKPNTKAGTMKSFVQTVKIIVWMLTIIICFAVYTDSKISAVLTGLTAFAAVLMLVFRDTILGFVASIQLSSNDSIRLGDWIVTSDGLANGTVTDMNLTYVKVRNSNNTVTYVPIYNLVSQPFTNWREMYAKGMRKLSFVSITLDTNFVRELDDKDMERISGDERIKPFYDNMKAALGSDKITNLAMFRQYMELYLASRKEINAKSGNVVTFTAHNGQGLTLQADSFSNLTVYSEWVHFQCSTVEHLISVTPVFDVVVCQQGTQTLPGSETVKISSPLVTEVETKNDQKENIS